MEKDPHIIRCRVFVRTLVLKLRSIVLGTILKSRKTVLLAEGRGEKEGGGGGGGRRVRGRERKNAFRQRL